jgi:transcriptional regulator with XRE-family HTH domain
MIEDFDIEQFQARVSELISETKHSPSAIGQLTGIRPCAMRHILKDKKARPAAQYIYALAIYFGVSSDYLLGIPSERGEADKELAAFLRARENAHIRESLYELMRKSTKTKR